jgi:hypothetical protein
MWVLRGDLVRIDGEVILRSAARASVASAATALLMLGGLSVLEGAVPAFVEAPAGRLITLIVLAGVGIAIFVLVAGALRSPELVGCAASSPGASREGRDCLALYLSTIRPSSPAVFAVAEIRAAEFLRHPERKCHNLAGQMHRLRVVAVGLVL